MNRPANPSKNEGMVMLIVMLVLLMSSASAVFAVRMTTSEMQAAGASRHALQTHYVAESGLTSGLALVDQLGPSAVLSAMESSTAPTLHPFEPDLLEGKLGYRITHEDFAAMAGMPVERDGLGGNQQAYTPIFVVDMNDVYVLTRTIAGSRADGAGRLQFMRVTYTGRGRTRVAGGDHLSGTPDDRQYHEGASDARAHGISGPFGR